jgi:hypothetical protein
MGRVHRSLALVRKKAKTSSRHARPFLLRLTCNSRTALLSSGSKGEIMSEHAPITARLLPHDAPDQSGARLFLQVVRRIGVGGLDDAHAASLLIGTFGLSFRRPLVLMRALMAELARASQQSIMIAPSCCCRMTIAESMLLRAVAHAGEQPRLAHRILCELCGIEGGIGVLSSAQAVAQAFADLGRPIETR